MEAKIPLLSVQGLQVTFQKKAHLFAQVNLHHAVDQISFAIYKGETLGIVGESGSGKSTTLKCISGLYQNYQGELHFENRPIKTSSQSIQMVFQNPFESLNPSMTIFQILKEPLLYFKICSRQNLLKQSIYYLEQVGLGEDTLHRYPHEFSGGQQQRIGIARALAANPKLLLCDEPVSALDVSIQAQILNLLKNLKEEFQLTVLFVSHDLSVVRHLCERILVMSEGKIVEEGATEQVIHEPKHPYTKSLIQALPKFYTEAH